MADQAADAEALVGGAEIGGLRGVADRFLRRLAEHLQSQILVQNALDHRGAALDQHHDDERGDDVHDLPETQRLVHDHEKQQVALGHPEHFLGRELAQGSQGDAHQPERHHAAPPEADRRPAELRSQPSNPVADHEGEEQHEADVQRLDRIGARAPHVRDNHEALRHRQGRRQHRPPKAEQALVANKYEQHGENHRADHHHGAELADQKHAHESQRSQEGESGGQEHRARRQGEGLTEGEIYHRA